MMITQFDRQDALEEIRRLKARYFRCMDTRDWQGYAATFAPDGILEVQSIRSDGISRCEKGREAIVAWVSGVLAGATTIHHGHMPEIVIGDADNANGIWAMEDRVIWPHQALHGFGHYHETYRRIDGVWLIASSRLTRLRVEVTPLDGTTMPDQPQMLDAVS